MEQQQPVARKPGRPGRKPKVNNATATPTTPAAPTSNAANADDESVAPDTTTAGDTPVAATPDRKASPVTAAEKSTTAKKAAKKVEDVTVLSGGRGKRTPKPNPRYMNEATVSLTKTSIKDDSADSETNDEENDEVLSSDDYRTPSDMPLKKRNLHQKLLQKSATTTITTMATTAGSAKKLTATGKVTPGVNVTRKTPVPAKRKLNAEADIDIDDDHGKQLFLAAKRRLTHSRSNSEDEFDKSNKSPKGDASALAAKLRAKYSDNLPVKRANNVKTTPASRGRGRPSAATLSASSKLTRVAKRDVDADQMPTFTIVNIDDIIDQKDGEHVVIKKQKKGDDTETSEDEVTGKTIGSDQESSPKNVNNRRKTQHTKILSDDKIVRTTRRTAPVMPAKPATTLIQTRLVPGTNKVTTQSPRTFQSLPRGITIAATSDNGRNSTKPAILRPPPPRILNSTLCKPSNKTTVPSLVTKLVTKNDFEEISNKQNNNTISSRSKENNVTSYTLSEKDGKLVQRKPATAIIHPSPQQRKSILPVVRSPTHQQHLLQQQQRIITSPQQANQQNRNIRKITCFETWYVIKMIESRPIAEKSNVNLSLLIIGNKIKDIELPSSEWTCKTILQPIDQSQTATATATATPPTPTAANRKTKATALANSKSNDIKQENENDASEVSTTTTDDTMAKADVYTGEVHDPNIDPNERHKYQPSTIMFRRKCQNPKVRIQFDRTVIFKNQTFYLNVDGKNVKLLGAPSTIDSFEDIKVLLEIINDVDLTSPCIELTSHPL